MKNKLARLALVALSAVAFAFALPCTTAHASDDDDLTPGITWIYSHFAQDSLTLYTGQHSGTPFGCMISGIEWTYTSSNPSVVSVDSAGNVLAKKAGTVTITATSVAKDGTRTDSMTIKVLPISKAPKNKTIVNYVNLYQVKYGETITFESLNGQKVKKIIDNKNIVVNSNKVTFEDQQKAGELCVSFKYTLAKGKTKRIEFCLEQNSEGREAEAMIRREMATYGITTESPDVEKAQFLFNYVTLRFCYTTGTSKDYSEILNQHGDCDDISGDIAHICDWIELPCVELTEVAGDHAFNGICIDGEWYCIDGLQCYSPYAYLFTNTALANSKAGLYAVNKNTFAFSKNSDPLLKASFTSTKYESMDAPDILDTATITSVFGAKAATEDAAILARDFHVTQVIFSNYKHLCGDDVFGYDWVALTNSATAQRNADWLAEQVADGCNPDGSRTVDVGNIFGTD